MTQQLDPVIWKALAPLADGFVPHVHRRYQLTRGYSFPVELIAQHPSLPDYYSCRPCCADDIMVAPDWVRISSGDPLDQ